MTSPSVVIIGAGHGGVELANSLRAQGFTRPITLIDHDPHLPYQRPPLSKELLHSVSLEPLPLRAARFFTDNAISLIRGSTVTAIDRRNRAVISGDGKALPYTELILATGARNRQLQIPGADARGVHYLRTLDEAAAVRQVLDDVKTAVIIGAGFIGLEFAAAARSHGIDVTVIDHGHRPLRRVVSTHVSDYLTMTHSTNGVKFVFEETASAVSTSGGALTAVVCRSGSRYPADLVLVGIGVEPNCELASATGLAIDDGIVVDQYLNTGDEHIWAIGDCATYPSIHARKAVRLESVPNATDHARHLAHTLTGRRTPYTGLPWIWSIQGRDRLQVAGAAAPYDRTVVHGDPATGKFSVLRFFDDALTGVESINSPAHHSASRKLLQCAAPPGYSDLAAVSFNPTAALRELSIGS